MNKPVKMIYRIREMGYGSKLFGIESRVKDNDALWNTWDLVGRSYEVDSNDPDMGFRRDVFTAEKFETGDLAKARIEELLRQYETDVVAFQEWEADAENRAELLRLKAVAEAKAREKFEKKNHIGEVFG